jgi:hypothetical protein
MAREFLHVIDDILEAVAGVERADEIIWKVAHDELPRLKLAVEAIKQSVNAP